MLLTGHTGFKGSWLALWLQRLGRAGHRYRAGAADRAQPVRRWRASAKCWTSHVVDIRDAGAVAAVVRAARPEIVFHLAAQALVRASYREPLQTFATNVHGHGARARSAACGWTTSRVVVVVTTDKVYGNREWP